MDAPLSCPTCNAALTVHDEGSFRCQEAHDYTVLDLALTTNIAALRAIWQAIRALEDDAASLNYMAQNYGDDHGIPAKTRRDEADAAIATAKILRGHAQRAQERLHALPATLTASSEPTGKSAR